MHTRASHVQYYKPHAMKEAYDWRTVAGNLLEDDCKRVIGVLNPSDKNPFHPVLFNLRSPIREDLNIQVLNEDRLFLDCMVNRGITAHTIYGNFLKQISHLSNIYSLPLAMHSQPRNPFRSPTCSPRQRFSTVASNRRFRPAISPLRDIFGVHSAAAPRAAAAFQPHPFSKGKRKRSFADRVSAFVNTLRNEFSDDDY